MVKNFNVPRHFHQNKMQFFNLGQPDYPPHYNYDLVFSVLENLTYHGDSPGSVDCGYRARQCIKDINSELIHWMERQICHNQFVSKRINKSTWSISISILLFFTTEVHPEAFVEQ